MKYQSASIAQFEGFATSMPAESLALMQSLEDASGHKMEEYVYVDMDYDVWLHPLLFPSSHIGQTIHTQ